MARQEKASYWVQGHRYFVHPYKWPAGKVEIFTSEKAMTDWAHEQRLVLKDACYRPGWRQ